MSVAAWSLRIPPLAPGGARPPGESIHPRAAASEWLFAGTTPDLEGMAVWPAIIGGLMVGVVVDLVAQYVAGPGGAQRHGAAVR